MSTQMIVIKVEVFPLNGNPALIIRACLSSLSGIWPSLKQWFHY